MSWLWKCSFVSLVCPLLSLSPCVSLSSRCTIMCVYVCENVGAASRLWSNWAITTLVVHHLLYEIPDLSTNRLQTATQPLNHGLSVLVELYVYYFKLFCNKLFCINLLLCLDCYFLPHPSMYALDPLPVLATPFSLYPPCSLLMPRPFSLLFNNIALTTVLSVHFWVFSKLLQQCTVRP